MPAGVGDPARPSGGNVYDLRVCAGLAIRGWSVREVEVAGAWPHPGERARVRLAQALGSVPNGEAVLVDGLIASTAPEALGAQADRLRLGVLVHMPLGHAFPSPTVARREERALAAAGVVVATSEWTKRWLLAAYRLDADLVRVALPGTDPAPLSRGSAHGNRLLAVGPVSEGKGHDVLIAALGRLGDLDWRVVCVGSLAVDTPTAGRVSRWARSSAGGRLRVAGPMVEAEVASAYAAADLLVHPSRSESYGMVVAEALARGIPVVASAVGGLGEALGVTERWGPPGLLCPPGDVEALAAALRSWLTDSELRESLRVAAAVRRTALPTWASTTASVDEALRAMALVGARS
jgi:glycosyltransferase involved in cell wall biosynthesis